MQRLRWAVAGSSARIRPFAWPRRSTGEHGGRRLAQPGGALGRCSEAGLAGAVLAMIKWRAVAAGLPASTCCHTFRATGVTAYLSNGGTLEHAQRIAGHASPKTTKLYDRTADTITVDEIGPRREREQRRHE